MSVEGQMSNPNVRRTSPIELVLAWGFVGIPLLWGIAMTLDNAVKIFK